MIKYSLIALAAAAVLFSVGCDDSECCGVESQTENVAPVVTKVLGMTDGSTVTCVPGNTKNLSANASDVNDNLDSNTYIYTVDGQKVTNGTVDCPEDGKTKEVCVTVKDEEGLVSNKACITLKGQAQQATCPPLEITATDTNATNNPKINGVANSTTENSSKLVGGHTYKFEHTRANCPMTCTWTTLQSTKVDGDFTAAGTPKKCIINGEIQDDAISGNHMQTGSSLTTPIEVTTCSGGDYKEIMIEINCSDGSSAVRYFDIIGG